MTFATVASTQLAVVPPEALTSALLRRFIETKAESWAEKASRAREFAPLTR